MSARRRARKVVFARRSAQTLFLLLFLGLLLATRAPDEGGPSPLLRLFFDLDPLVLAATWLATHSLEGLSLLALATLAVTLLIGRVFCGWFCPFGTLHNMISFARSRESRRGAALASFVAWQRAKYYLLAALLFMALLGAHWIGVFDPFSLLYRSVSTALLPAVQYVVEEGATAIYDADPHAGALHLTAVTEPAYRFLRDRVFVTGRGFFTGNTLLFLIFAGFLLLNLARPRFWCRYVCPLGALLGLTAGRTVLRLRSSDADCGRCDLCALACPAAAQPEKPGEWLPRECFGCWNCVASCNRNALDFRWESPFRRPAAGSIDLSKRATLAAFAAGVGALLTLRLPPQAQGKTFHPALIRPPGARAERAFLDRCIQCGLCMKACPPCGLHPAGLEAGIEGIWSPVLLPRIGYCEYECNLCGQVCPTGAIEPLPLAEKKKVVIGLATIDTTRCLPYAYGRSCIVCEEHCPIPTKAIRFVEQEVVTPEGTARLLKQPRVVPDLCTGCGICENVCPFEDLPAIRITSANETRHPANRPFLAAPAASPAAPAAGGKGAPAYGGGLDRAE